MQHVEQFIDSDTVSALLDRAMRHRDLERRRYLYSTAMAVPMMWLEDTELVTTWHCQLSEVTGLPLEHMSQPPAFIAFRPGDHFPSRHTAFDMKHGYGRVMVSRKQWRQRYAEALIMLSAGKRGEGLLKTKSVIASNPGDLIWWKAADENHNRLPEAEHSVTPVTGDWVWYLMFRWRRPVDRFILTKIDKDEHRVAEKAGRVEGHRLAHRVLGDRVQLF